MDETIIRSTGDPSITRRTIVKGAAWSLPVIAAAVAMPAQAASGTDLEIEFLPGDVITHWKGDHHYGSHDDDPERRAYDFTVVIKDSSGMPAAGVAVTVTASGTNRDGDLLGVYRWPAPDNGGPEEDPHRTATTTTDASGRALFAVSTQNLSSSERPATAYLTVVVTHNGTTITRTITVTLTDSD